MLAVHPLPSRRLPGCLVNCLGVCWSWLVAFLLEGFLLWGCWEWHRAGEVSLCSSFLAFGCHTYSPLIRV